MKTPQQKKRLSYAKDRRNSFGENSKASRKGVPLAKARANRSERHAQDHLLAQSRGVQTHEELAAVEVQVRSTKPRQWRKSADVSLGEVLARRRQRQAESDRS
ncbi:hypothetical protein [Caldimonas brevitalea]|uniref:hypothetical protein n=1 Tax=Caldimonas brevitalea TaxID=413882 RepID=UPI0012F8E4E3|nr:hypothetical protein [Caldimonas brevitalea]